MTTLHSLIETFDKEIIRNPTKPLKEKYWIVVELQTSLKKIFEYSYEYELFKTALQDYYNGLKKLSDSTTTRVRKFSARRSSSLSREKRTKGNIVYNNYNKTRFGEPLTDPLLLGMKTDSITDLKQEMFYVSSSNGKKHTIKCDFDFFLVNNTLYDIEQIPYVGSTSLESIFQYYLYSQHQRLHNRYDSDKSTALPCEIFYSYCPNTFYLSTNDDEVTNNTDLNDSCTRYTD